MKESRRAALRAAAALAVGPGAAASQRESRSAGLSSRGSGLYVARIPGAFLRPEWDLMYFIEAIDKHGSGRNYPHLEGEAPYVIVPVDRRSRGR